MSKTTNNSLISVSGPTLLTALFVLLKAFGKIDWSWWWVFSPLWIPLAVVLVILLIVGACLALAALFAR